MVITTPIKIMAIFIASVVMVLSIGTASAATIFVDDNCSLADAISAANTNEPVFGCEPGSGDDSIEITADIILTGPTSPGSFNGLPFLTSPITINGNNHTLSRDPDSAEEFRLLVVFDNGEVTINDWTITGGALPAPFEGGGLFVDTAASLTLNNVSVTGNSAGQTGGGIYSAGELILNSSTISDNVAGLRGGGISSDSGVLTATDTQILNNMVTGGNLSIADENGGGGAFVNRGSLSLTGGRVSGNMVSFYTGGGLYLESVSDGTITGVSIANNQAGRNGGGIYHQGGDDFTYDDSAFIRNTSRNGGGLYATRATNYTVRNSTFSGNHARISGGGISTFGTGSTRILNTTISDNTAALASGGGIIANGETATSLFIINTIISGNRANSGSEIAAFTLSFFFDCIFCLIGDNSKTYTNALLNFDPVSGTGFFTEGNILLTQDTPGGLQHEPTALSSVLSSLTLNEGPTEVHPLVAGSSAIDSGSNPFCLATDQRGVDRDSQCDIGAYEYVEPLMPVDDEFCFPVLSSANRLAVVCL